VSHGFFWTCLKRSILDIEVNYNSLVLSASVLISYTRMLLYAHVYLNYESSKIHLT